MQPTLWSYMFFYIFSQFAKDAELPPKTINYKLD